MTNKSAKGSKNYTYMALTMLCVLLLSITLPSAFAYAAPESQQQTTVLENSQQAEEAETSEGSTDAKAISAALAIGLGAAAAAIAMGFAIGKSSESIARQPEAEGSIRTNLLLGLVFIETAVIYALVIAIMIIFVL